MQNLPVPIMTAGGCYLKNAKENHPRGGKKLGMKLPFTLISHGVQFWWEDVSFLREHKGCPSRPQREVTFSAGCLCPPNFQSSPPGQFSLSVLITALIRHFLPVPRFSPHRLHPFLAGNAFSQPLPMAEELPAGMGRGSAGRGSHFWQRCLRGCLSAPCPRARALAHCSDPRLALQAAGSCHLSWCRHLPGLAQLRLLKCKHTFW